MIEGTKPFRRRGSETPPAASPENSAMSVPADAAPEKDLGAITPAVSSPEMADEIAFEASAPDGLQAGPDAVNLERRAWFASLVPAFGEGLVQLLRTSNNLKRDLHEAMKEGSEAIAEAERRRRSEEEKKQSEQ